LRRSLYNLRTKLLFCSLSLAWASAITNFSRDSFSIKRTSKFFEPLLKWLFPGASDVTIYVLHVIIRKSGHLIEYGIFACLIFGIFSADEIRWRKRWLGYALIISALLATADEYHQSFSRMRVGSASDAVIDTIGAATALFFLWRIKEEKFNPSREKK
jgi:VanZ family protein